MKIIKNLRLSYLPPLMIYFAAGISGFTAIIESFFVKDQLGLSASFLASLAFWAGLPWTFKMPLGHLVDLFWKRKAWFVYFGALLLAFSILIMVGLTGNPAWMQKHFSLEIWYIVASLLAPIGFAMQDVVADAMTVEAVPHTDSQGTPIAEKKIKDMHMTMQTLGRIAIIGGSALVAGIAGWLAVSLSYNTMYKMALALPLISISGVLLHNWLQKQLRKKLQSNRFKNQAMRKIINVKPSADKPDWGILGGSALLVGIIIGLGFSPLFFKEELVFLGTLGVIIFLMKRLIQGMERQKRLEIAAIAVIIFVFRAMPTVGAGASWWEIDVLGFDEPFFGSLSQISAILAIIGMLVLKKWITNHPIPYLVIFLSIVGTVLSLPIIGMFYGLHEWTQQYFGFGARTIALVDIAAVSPLGQIAMIPMLAWIAQKAPMRKKATYFAVFSAFTNLALSASSLLTKYMNQLFLVQRGDYSALGMLLITVALISLFVPILTVILLYPVLKKKPGTICK